MLPSAAEHVNPYVRLFAGAEPIIPPIYPHCKQELVYCALLLFCRGVSPVPQRIPG